MGKDKPNLSCWNQIKSNTFESSTFAESVRKPSINDLPSLIMQDFSNQYCERFWMIGECIRGYMSQRSPLTPTHTNGSGTPPINDLSNIKTLLSLHTSLNWTELISILQRLLGQSRRLMRYIILNHGVSRTLMKTASFPSIFRAAALVVLVDMCGRERRDVCPKLSSTKNNQASGKTRVIRQLLVDYVQNITKKSCFHKQR